MLTDDSDDEGGAPHQHTAAARSLQGDAGPVGGSSLAGGPPRLWQGSAFGAAAAGLQQLPPPARRAPGEPAAGGGTERLPAPPPAGRHTIRLLEPNDVLAPPPKVG